MLIRSDNRPTYVSCKRCGKTFKMGSSCGCGAVVTREIRGGAFIVEESDTNVASIDTE